MSFVERDLKRQGKKTKAEPGVIVFESKKISKYQKNKKKRLSKASTSSYSTSVVKTGTGRKEKGKKEKEKEIIVDFDFYDSNEFDFHSVKSFIDKLFIFSKQSLPSSALADLIISDVTTTVKTDGEESDALGFITLLDPSEGDNDEEGIISTFIKAILKTAPDSKLVDKKKKIGLLLNERIINMPNETSLPLFKFLIDNNSGENCEYCLYLTTTYKFVDVKVDSEGTSTSSSSSALSKDFKFYKEEDEILKEYSEINWHFPCQLQDSDSKRAFQEEGVELGRSVMLIKYSQLKKFYSILESFISLPSQ